MKTNGPTQPSKQSICSAKKVPDGAVLILNYSPNELRIQLGRERYTVNDREEKIFQTGITEKLALRVVANNGKRKAFLFKNYVKHKKGYRTVIVVYPKPSSGSYLKVAMTLVDIPLAPIIPPQNR